VYLPAHFREDDLPRLHALMREYPLGTLVTAGPAGLVANHIPFLLYPDEGRLGTLRAHLARANDQLDELARVAECLIVFQGPEGYVSPGWYPSKREHGKVVPTWNFVAVHAWGVPRVVDDPAWLRRQVEDLTNLHEARHAPPWHVDDAPTDYLRQMLGGIVGLEIPLQRIEGKWKVSQNRAPADREGVATGLLGQGKDPLAALVSRDLPGAD
jgi:transcriptional regulator